MKNEEFQRLTIDINELSHALGIRRHAILQHRSGVRAHPLLLGLPQPAAVRPRLTWWAADIQEWVNSRRTFRPSAPAAPEPELRRPRGRRRKTAAVGGEGGGEK
jgi:predicted DNA-binding transcriptional regulator AlpA